MPVPVGIRPVLSKYRVEVCEGAVPLPTPPMTFAQGLFLSLSLATQRTTSHQTPSPIGMLLGFRKKDTKGPAWRGLV